jgi:hypothetical protein
MVLKQDNNGGTRNAQILYKRIHLFAVDRNIPDLCIREILNISSFDYMQFVTKFRLQK